MATTGEDVERLLSGIFPSPAKHGGGCGGVTERRWFTPCRPLKSHLSRSRRSVCNSTPPYPPPGENIPTYVPPYQIDDYVPTEEEVKWVVQRLQGHWSGGTSRIRAYHLREWLREHQDQKSGSEA